MVIESDVARSIGAGASRCGEPVGVVGFDFDLAPLNKSRNPAVGVGGLEKDLEGFFEGKDGAKSEGDGLEWAGGRK